MAESSLSLHAVEPDDVDFMLECEADSQASRWSDYPAPFSRQQLLDYALSYDADPFSAGQLRLIAKDSSGQSVGILDLFNISSADRKAYVGILIHPGYRERGFGIKALLSLSEFCKERLGLNQLLAEISTQNPGALRLFSKAGYETLVVLPSWHRIGQRLHDFALLRLPL